MVRNAGKFQGKLSGLLGGRRLLMLIVLGGLASALAYGAYRIRRKPPIIMDTVRLRSTALQPESLSPEIEALGTVEFFEKVSITARTAGKIEKIYVKEGELVQKGDLLVQIERLPLELELQKGEAALEAAKAELGLVEERYYEARQSVHGRVKEIEKKTLEVNKARTDLKRVKAMFEGKQILYKEGGISLQEYRAVRSELVSAESAFESARKDLEIVSIGYRKDDIIRRGFKIPEDPEKLSEMFVDLNTLKEKAEVNVAKSRVQSEQVAVSSTRKLLEQTSIRSPIRGVVAVRNKSVGEDASVGSGGSVNPDQAILVVVDIDRVYANVKIRESDVKHLSTGQVMHIATDAYAGTEFKADVRVIKPLIDQKTHTAEVKAILPNADLKLRPGMYVRARIVTGKPRPMLLVPQSALLPAEGEAAWVFVVRDSKTFRVEVRTGRQVDDKIEILSGLHPGDRIALEKLSQLKDGMTVEPVDDERPTAQTKNI